MVLKNLKKTHFLETANKSDFSRNFPKKNCFLICFENWAKIQFFSEKFSQNFFTIDASQEVSKIQKELMNIIKKGQK